MGGRTAATMPVRPAVSSNQVPLSENRMRSPGFIDHLRVLLQESTVPTELPLPVDQEGDGGLLARPIAVHVQDLEDQEDLAWVVGMILIEPSKLTGLHPRPPCS